MSNSEIQSSNQAQKPNDKVYDLEERTAVFGEEIIVLLKNVPDSSITKPLKSQLIRSATSIGANYMEADAASSKRDFNHKIGLCKKESKETLHWLRMLSAAYPSVSDKSRSLWKEAHEFVLIFSSILKSSRTGK